MPSRQNCVIPGCMQKTFPHYTSRIKDRKMRPCHFLGIEGQVPGQLAAAE